MLFKALHHPLQVPRWDLMQALEWFAPYADEPGQYYLPFHVAVDRSGKYP